MAIYLKDEESVISLSGSGSISKEDILDLIYPIGSIYMTVDSTDPSETFGGTWEQWADGQVPVGIGFDPEDPDFAGVERTGGEREHTLVTSEMPSHTHTFTGTAASHAHTGYWHAGKDRTAAGSERDTPVSQSYSITTNTQYSQSTSSTSVTPKGTNASTGGGGAHNNLQPYITCYMWKRIA